MSKSKLQGYNVHLFVIVENKKGERNKGILTFSVYSEDKYNAVKEVIEDIKLSSVISQRAMQVDYDDELTWYDAVKFVVAKVVDVEIFDLDDYINNI